ncbi:hypothetical protein [Paracoccus tegillarcae]|uniref:Uncharacterized protein n=1 Tax=Paracoccus tegillarcae TaxID=1529068 RepID=A0A2K9ESG6_9RHOB|nr:hypothetical protein [Paracoccus tegillarcae]AUH33766.1 hypothetical protein CUV01_10525 [Paracoccus tegillarcae]
MVTRRAKLAELARLAQLKSDLELKRFAAFSSNVDATRKRITQQDAAIAWYRSSQAPDSLDESNLASLRLGDATREAARARQELSHMLPRFDQARQRAAGEFGRAAVLRRLSERDDQ